MIAVAREIVARAWTDLPQADRDLLQAARADGWVVVDRPLGECLDDLRRSAGYIGLPPDELRHLNAAAGLWAPELRLVIINVSHASFSGLDRPSLGYAIAWVAWHEWGHALASDRMAESDVGAGRRLLGLAPPAMAASIRSAGYGRREYVHELVAETYALLLACRRRGITERPSWLHVEIYELVRRVGGWSR